MLRASLQQSHRGHWYSDSRPIRRTWLEPPLFHIAQAGWVDPYWPDSLRRGACSILWRIVVESRAFYSPIEAFKYQDAADKPRAFVEGAETLFFLSGAALGFRSSRLDRF